MKIVRTIVGTVLSFFVCLVFEASARAQSKDVLTYHNDNARTGQHTNETILSPANVNFSNFGRLWFLNADAHVDAEPLRAGGVLIPGVGFRNVVFVATENDSVYAYDADSTNLFWQASLLGVGETASDDRGCMQVTPLIGITGAPVIDRQLGTNGTLFAVAMSKVTASGAYVQRLYALDLATGTNRMPAVTITGTYPGTGDNSSGGSVIFDPAQYKERAGLLLLGGVIYTAWASHCDGGLYTGWIMGYDERTLAQTNIINVTPNGRRGAIWMGNTALAADSSSNIVFLDANGTFDGLTNANGFPVNNDFGNAFIKLSTSNQVLAVADYFATSNTISQSTADQDLGSGGAIVLPSMNDSHGVAHQLAVGAGKDANIYIVDLANMGKWNSNSNVIYQQVSGALGSSVFSMPAFFGGTLYYCANGDRLRSFPFASSRLGAMSAQSPSAAGSTGATPSISASNGLNGIVWVVQAPNA
ncbi:MAG TPA: pyrrolo-quinoline quinone, partial [Verrucomicrobiae bacterium]|nr:pyrrolo-quinoline quinone [Verrucomicrobiae bacterium]